MTAQKRFVTPEDIIKAAEENGYEWSRSGWFKYSEDGTITEACVIGQVAINLGVERDSMAMYLATFKIPSDSPLRKKFPDLYDAWGIVNLNDNVFASRSPKTYKGIVSILKQALLAGDSIKKKGVYMQTATYKARKKKVRITRRRLSSMC